jgi:hypothetical protein
MPMPGTPPTPAAAIPERGVDQQRHDDIVAMVRDPDRSREYWRSETIQQEFPDVLTRLSGEAPASGPQVPAAAVQPPLSRASGTRFDTSRRFLLTVGMNERRESAVQLIVFAAFVAAVLIVVMTSLTSISGQCMRGTPFLPGVFPCFAGR